MYRTSSFYIAKVLSDLPWQIFFPALFSTVTYWMIGFNPHASNFFIFVGILVLAANVGSSLGLLLGILAKDSGTAISLTPIVIMPFMIFSGFFVNSDNVPPYFIWIEYISFVKYGFRALVLNEMQGLKFTCTASQQIMSGKYVKDVSNDNCSQWTYLQDKHWRRCDTKLGFQQGWCLCNKRRIGIIGLIYILSSVLLRGVAMESQQTKD
jgi:ABC-type multidrug transport system permease subunit